MVYSEVPYYRTVLCAMAVVAAHTRRTAVSALNTALTPSSGRIISYPAAAASSIPRIIHTRINKTWNPSTLSWNKRYGGRYCSSSSMRNSTI